jgi:hypothetical protein
MFLCVINKQERRLMLFQTTPKYYYWTIGGTVQSPESLNLVPDVTAVEGDCGLWHDPCSASLSAPILNFTVEELADDRNFQRFRDVLDSWIDLEYDNLSQMTTRTRHWVTPDGYRTNEPIDRRPIRWQFGPAATVDEVCQVMGVLSHSLAWVMHGALRFGDWPGALRVALLLRHFCSEERRGYVSSFSHNFDRLLGVTASPYLYAALDRIASHLDAHIPKSGGAPQPNESGPVPPAPC